jgi:F-type H+-transporting ATPase subunit delta
MIEKTLAKRYAQAMLSVAGKEGVVPEVETLLLVLKEAYVKDEAFRKMLAQPRIPKAARKKILRKAFEGKAPASFLDLLDLLVDKNRIGLIPDIADSYDLLADEVNGVLRVQVFSTFPLSPAHEKMLHTKLKAATGKTIEIHVNVDPGLKGGLAVRVGDRIIDGTVLYRLKYLRERLLERSTS